ncbi:MAG TPA: hypothetical protein PLU30_20055 [Verrucomicrobiae bacterium]|nr:hypothetical protein [Verrucomicrobiae bacterium]
MSKTETVALIVSLVLTLANCAQAADATSSNKSAKADSVANVAQAKTGKLLKREVAELSSVASQLLGGGARAIVEFYYLDVAVPGATKEQLLSLGQFSGPLEATANPLVGKKVTVIGQYDEKERRMTDITKISAAP